MGLGVPIVNRPKFLGRSKTPRIDVAKCLMKYYGYDEHVALELVTSPNFAHRGCVQRGVTLDSTAQYVASEIWQSMQKGGS